jgi:hypothetical protein
LTSYLSAEEFHYYSATKKLDHSSDHFSFAKANSLPAYLEAGAQHRLERPDKPSSPSELSKLVHVELVSHPVQGELL